MKIIFLDIDGVLNDIENFPQSEVFPFNKIEKDKVSLLNEIVNHTGAKVVISSSWRRKHSYLEMDKILKTLGFCGEVISETPRLPKEKKISFLNRSKEIESWLENNSVSNFVILDDTPSSEFSEKIISNLVQIDDFQGMNENHVKKAIEILRQ